ncbi:FAS1-like dehydratase domain-containing protein [Thermogemmatispora carboxidivorans]|uniref:FAS1-like dehydratase domain-containing protein n=1 Tax=Thermogemmatispora carboxidivorans TaxID=1382306 RepID=UPI00069A987A|nr:MaoC family dehydratase N-terminal domain-containing protein [Thermogemmatispora carboxidivorans]
MAIDPSVIGKTAAPQTFEVTEEAVRRFMEATGDPALERQTPLVYAPPTFPTTFRVRPPELQIDPSRMQLLHGEQSYSYQRRLRIGEQVTCVARVADVRERSGRSGPMTFVILETEGRDANGQLLFTAEGTLIVRAKKPD